MLMKVFTLILFLNSTWASDFSFPKTEADHYVSKLPQDEIKWQEDPKDPTWRWRWFDGFFSTLSEQNVESQGTIRSLNLSAPIVGLEAEQIESFEEKLIFHVSIVANLSEMPKGSSIEPKTLFRCTAKLTEKSIRSVGRKVGLRKDLIQKLISIRLGASESQEKTLGSELYYVSPVFFVPESYTLPDGDETSFFGVNHAKAVCNKHFEGKDVFKLISERLEFVQRSMKGAITCNLDKTGKGKDQECQNENVSGLVKIEGYTRECIPLNSEVGSCQYRLDEKSICHRTGSSMGMLAQCGKNMMCAYDQKLSEFIRSKYVLLETDGANIGELRNQGHFLSKHHMVTVNLDDEFGFCRNKTSSSKDFFEQNSSAKSCQYNGDNRWDFHLFFRELVRVSSELKRLELNSSSPLSLRKKKTSEVVQSKPKN